MAELLAEQGPLGEDRVFGLVGLVVLAVLALWRATRRSAAKLLLAAAEPVATVWPVDTSVESGQGKQRR